MDTKQKMDQVLKHLDGEFSTLQIWRASTSLIDNVDVYIPAWWMTQKMSQVASTSLIDWQTIKIQPWDKWTISSIEKWIYDANLGLTPINQWDYVMIKVPALTQERRKELTKIVSKYGEESKIALRNIRQDYLKDIKKQFDEKTISEDEKKRFEKEIDDRIKEYSKKVDDHVDAKSQEIMKV